MNYTEEEMQLYSTYMNYVREVVKDNTLNHPDWVIKEMMDGKTLTKINNSIWALQVINNNNTYKIPFMSFDAWQKCEERDKRLNALLEKLEAIKNV